MPTLPLPDEFQRSFANCKNYPVNLIPSGTSTYRSTLESYEQRLDAVESSLCLVEGEDDINKNFEVHFRDLVKADGQGMK